MQEKVGLKRSLGLVSLTFYGLGTIVGAGIYVLIGEVAGVAGVFLPLSFLLAGLIAIFTALSYAELSTRFPVCAGEAVYVEQAWHLRRLSALTGWMIILTGVVSAAAIANGFVGYINLFFDMSRSVAIIGLVLALSAIAILGIQASVVTIFLITLIEVAGLLYVIIFSFNAEAVNQFDMVSLSTSKYGINGIVMGSFLAFYAFIGFEDMVNVIEEVKQPARNFPIAILLAIVLSVIFYCAVSIAALRIISPEQLSQSAAPLADLISLAGGNPAFIGMISLLAVINGGLVQIIMGSRVLYGMANNSMAPAFLSVVNIMTKTPVYATLIICFCVMSFALLLPLAKLAQLTSLIMLLVFILINLALIVIKSRVGSAYKGLSIPIWVPIVGATSSAVLVVYQALILKSLLE
ncbi:amino acid permease [Gammaproteobacteria bacterium]|nr:amino acid permease [Gammaproteobacteria bacterium]